MQEKPIDEISKRACDYANEQIAELGYDLEFMHPVLKDAIINAYEHGAKDQIVKAISTPEGSMVSGWFFGMLVALFGSEGSKPCGFIFREPEIFKLIPVYEPLSEEQQETLKEMFGLSYRENTTGIEIPKNPFSPCPNPEK